MDCDYHKGPTKGFHGFQVSIIGRKDRADARLQLMNREPKEVAKQLATYADAITAFSVVQSVAFGFALAGNDLSAKMIRAPWWLVPGVCLVAYTFYAITVWRCQHAEDTLFVGSEESKKADGWAKEIRYWRIWIIVLAAALSLIAYGLTRYGPSLFKGSAPTTGALGLLQYEALWRSASQYKSGALLAHVPLGAAVRRVFDQVHPVDSGSQLIVNLVAHRGLGDQNTVWVQAKTCFPKGKRKRPTNPLHVFLDRRTADFAP
jgi:hypothetical protein